MRQAQALQVLLQRGSVFLTGAPGAGKSYVLNKFVRLAEAEGRHVAVTASTGIAATHIGGTTIHSWSGLGIRDMLSQHDIDVLVARDRLVKRYLTTDVLVIDEISMLSGRFLDMLNEICKRLRDSDEPFGGMQMVLVGDMFQLPPVNRANTTLDFAHDAAAWAELAPQICYISEQHRQTGGGLLEVLEAMRAGSLEEAHYELLQGRLGLRPDDGVNVTRLYAHNADVDTINQRHLDALGGSAQQFEMKTKGAAAKVEQLARGILAPAVLELKVGAEVMFVANDFAKGFANGTRGRVVSLHGEWPVVELASNGRPVAVEPHTWQLAEDGKVRAEVSQLPLRLAWAITIHKSQGMSLDAAEIDLSRTFTPGMGYVALSRVRSLDGVYLQGMNAMALRLHSDIFELDKALRRDSSLLAERIVDFAEPDPVDTPVAPLSSVSPDGPLLEKLKTWRRVRSEAEHVPAYIIAHNSLLEDIARRVPCDERSLLTVKGMGQTKLDKIGQDILKITREFCAEPAHSHDDGTAALRAESADQYSATAPTAYARSRAPWTRQEDELLIARLQTLTPLDDVCRELDRSPGTVWVHVAALLNREG